MSQTRRLAAILAADVAGYSRLMGADEEGTLKRLKALRRELLDPKIAEHKGRLVKTTGDGLLVEFGSVVDALRCAVDVQREISARNAGMPSDNRIEFRIGINVGDIVVEDGDIFGDGVNVAARLEGLAEPGGICVAARVQEDAAGKLDLVFEDLGEQQLKNIARPVRAHRICTALTHPAAIAPGSPLSRITGEGPERQRREAGEGSWPALALPDKPSIAVLPFANMSGDPEQEYFADGMVEEIITALSRIRWLFVIARNSTFTYKGQAIDVKRVGRELGVRYVLEGSVRKGGGRVRITAQLIEAQTGAHLWADRFDGSLEDVFDLQDQVASSVAGVIEPALQAAETARSAHRPTRDLSAYDLYLRALAMSPTPQAFQVLEEAIARDPHYGPALALGASWSMNLVSDGAAPDRDANRQKGIGFARRALAVAGNDPGVLADAASALACFGEDIVAMTALVDRALTFNPNYARGWHASSFLRLWAGQTDFAIEHAGIALRLSPRAGGNEFLGNRCRAVLQPAFRGSDSETLRRCRGETHLRYPLSDPCSLLCAYGAAGRGAGNGWAAAHAHLRGDSHLPAPLSRGSVGKVQQNAMKAMIMVCG
jgi:TolB-like protein/class 3 adenylate cyclase